MTHTAKRSVLVARSGVPVSGAASASWIGLGSTLVSSVPARSCASTSGFLGMSRLTRTEVHYRLSTKPPASAEMKSWNVLSSPKRSTRAPRLALGAPMVERAAESQTPQPVLARGLKGGARQPGLGQGLVLLGVEPGGV